MSFVGDWGAAPGVNGGTLVLRPGATGDYDLLGVRAAHSPGTFDLSDSALTGTFVVSSTGFISLGPAMRWSAGGTGLLRINGDTFVTIDSLTESSSDPLVSFGVPLAIGYLPEPYGVCLLYTFGWVLLMRRRTR